jgi:O-antigen/teichoic acid export membrane protein
VQHKLGRSTIIYLAANIANAAVPFLLLPIMTRVLDPADYGIIAMFAATLGVFSAFAGLSVHGAVTVRYFQLGTDVMKDYVTTCLIILGSSTLVLVVLVFLASPFLTTTTGLPRGWLVLGVFVAAAQITGQIRLALWQVSGKPLHYGTFQFGQTLTNALLSLYLIIAVGFAWQGRLIGQSLALCIFGTIGLGLLYMAGYVGRPRNFRSHAIDALRFGVPLIPHVIGGLMIVTVDRFIIAGLLGLASAGIYMVAVQIGQVLGLLADAFNKAYAPWLMRQLSGPTDDITRVRIVRGTYLYFMIAICTALAIGITAPVIVGLMVGTAFQDAQTIVIYIALGYAFSACYLMVTNYIFYESRTALLAYVTFATGVINIVLTYILVHRNGVVGAGQAFMISQLLAFFGTWWLSQRVHRMPWLAAFSS